MKKTLLLLAILLIGSAAIWAVIATIRVPEIEGTIVDGSGQPISGCFIIYDYWISGDGWSYERSRKAGSISETDSNGHFKIPGKTFLLNPLFHEEAHMNVSRIFSPKTHTATTLAADWSYPGTIEDEIEGRPRERKLIFYDASNYPAAWFRCVQMMEQTLSDINMAKQINRSKWRKMSPYLENCDNEISRLVIATSNDVVNFKRLYYDTPYQQTKAYKIPTDLQLGKTYGRLLDHGNF